MHMASTSLAIVAYVYEYPLYRMINQWTQDAIIIHNVAILSLYNPYNTFSATTPIQALQPYMPIQSLVSTQLVYQPTAQIQYSSQYLSAGLYVA